MYKLWYWSESQRDFWLAGQDKDILVLRRAKTSWKYKWKITDEHGDVIDGGEGDV